MQILFLIKNNAAQHTIKQLVSPIYIMYVCTQNTCVNLMINSVIGCFNICMLKFLIRIQLSLKENYDCYYYYFNEEFAKPKKPKKRAVYIIKLIDGV